MKYLNTKLDWILVTTAIILFITVELTKPSELASWLVLPTIACSFCFVGNKVIETIK